MKKHILNPLLLLLTIASLFSACCKDPIADMNSVAHFEEVLPGTTWKLYSKYKVYRTEVENVLEEEIFQDCSAYDELVFENDSILTVRNPFCTNTWGNSGFETWDGVGLGGLSTQKYVFRSNLRIHGVSNRTAIVWYSVASSQDRAHYLYQPNDTTLVLWASGYGPTVTSPQEHYGRASKFYLKN